MNFYSIFIIYLLLLNFDSEPEVRKFNERLVSKLELTKDEIGLNFYNQNLDYYSP